MSLSGHVSFLMTPVPLPARAGQVILRSPLIGSGTDLDPYRGLVADVSLPAGTRLEFTVDHVSGHCLVFADLASLPLILGAAELIADMSQLDMDHALLPTDQRDTLRAMSGGSTGTVRELIEQWGAGINAQLDPSQQLSVSV